jgi:hypothetical protein
LHDDDFLPGKHEIFWMLSANEQQPGIYLVSLETSAGYRVVKRIVIAKDY